MPQSIEELLVRLCRRDAQERVGPAEIQMLEDPGAAERLLEQSALHGVRALVLLRIHEAAARSPAAATRLGTLLEPLVRLRKQSTLWDLEQARILGALRTAGIRAVVLKGGALRHMAYSRPTERWMGDLDLLVSSEDMEPARSAFSLLGYSSGYSETAQKAIEVHHYHDLLKHRAGFIVEVHQGLTRPGDPCRLDAASFLNRAHEIPGLPGQRMWVPKREDMVLHLVSQIEQEGCRRLSRIVDLDRVVAADGPLDWEDIGRRAGEGNLEVSLALSLRLANLLLSTPAPAWALDGRCVPRVSRWGIAATRPVAYLLFRRGQLVVAAGDVLRLWLLAGWRDRGARIRSFAATRADPLQWVWEGKDTPDGDGDEPAMGGPSRVLKLMAYQLWTLVSAARAGASDGFGGRKFWADAS